MSTRNLDLSQHYLLDLGATMVGALVLAGSPTSDLMAASKAYVDTKVAQGGGGSGTGFPESPLDGQTYGRRGQSSQWLPVAPLDATGKVPYTYLPAAQGTLSYKSGWNPTTNVPVLATGGLAGGVKAAKGDYYVALVSGTASPAIDGITTVNAGDWLVSNGATWERQQNSAGVYLPLAGGTATGNITAPSLTVQNAGAFLRGSTSNLPLVVTDQWGFVGARWNGDNTWQFPGGLVSTNLTGGALSAITSLGFVSGGGPISALSALNFASGDQIYYTSTGPANLLFLGKYGMVGASWNRDGTWSFPAGITNTPIPLINPTAPSFSYKSGAWDVETYVSSIPGIALALTDKYGLSSFAISTTGIILGGGVGTDSTTTYSQAEITARSNAALARAAAVRGQTNTTAARPVWKYNHVICYGQSETFGFAGTPSITKTQPFDNLMLGQNTRAQPMGGTTWVPRLDNAFHPMVPIDQLNTGAPVTIKTGSVQGCTGVTFAASGLITIATGGALNSVFAPGDTFQMAGWTGASANLLNDWTYTVSTVTATTIQVTTTAGTPDIAAQNGIGFWQWGGAYYGEGYEIEMTNFWRRQQLDLRGLAADPSRLLVASIGGKPGTPIALLAKGASPELFNQLRDCVNAGKAAATAAGGDYGIPAIVYTQGGTDAINGTDYTSYKAAFLQMYPDMCNDLMPLSGQAKQPFYFFYQVSDGTTTDTNDMAVARAQYECMVTPPGPNWYCLGPSYQTTDYTPHQDNNGYRQMGGTFGKILHRVIDRGEGWMPLHPTAITSRGRQILVDFHVPSPPLQAQPFYNKHLAVSYTDLGFTVLDDAGTAPISSAAIVSDACVLIIVGRDLSTNPKLRYGDASHTGGGNLCDSDPAVAEVPYVYVDGSGQGPSSNIPALIGKPQSLFNWCCLFSVPIVAG
jgi:hypothetical protein